MSIFFISVAVFSIAFLGMAIGAIISGRYLRGSCGGLTGFRDGQENPLCESCTNPTTECEEFRTRQSKMETNSAGTSGPCETT